MMKNILISIVVALLLWGLIAFVRMGIENTNERTYCGKVVNVYMTPAGYKVHPKTRLVFYCDSLKRNIDVNVNFQTYSNSKPGEFVCFDLNRMQLEQ